MAAFTNSCSLGNGLHSISGWFKVGLGWLVNAYSSHSIHKAKEVGPQRTKRSFPRMQGDGFASEPDGIMEMGHVALSTNIWEEPTVCYKSNG